MNTVTTLPRYVKMLARHEAGLAAVGEEIPFDVSGHEQAGSEVAKSHDAWAYVVMALYSYDLNSYGVYGYDRI